MQSETHLCYSVFGPETPSKECKHSLQQHSVTSSLQTPDSFGSILSDYFQLDVKVKDLYESWCSSDPAFKKVAETFSGVRILRQDPVENLFSFICSSNNHISRIGSMVEKLCENYGESLGDLDDKEFFCFPTIEALAAEGVEQNLRHLGFGYRAKYISEAARQILNQGDISWLHSLREKPYKEARRELMKLHGVGAKVKQPRAGRATTRTVSCHTNSQ